MLCDQEGLSREEAAKSIGASVASLKTELHRARKKMTEVFETHCQLVDEEQQVRRLHRRRPHPAPRRRRPARQRRANRIARTQVAPPRRGTRWRALIQHGVLTCDQIDELLSDLLADELAHTARAGVEAHLATCETCAASYKAMKRTVRFVQAHANVPLDPGTPGGAYSAFTRAMMDEDYGREPIAVIAEVVSEAVFGKKGSAS